MKYIKKSFTLIEMLIVIVIIGILAAALVPRLQSVQGRARDTKRKADLQQVVNALEIYLVDNTTYPNNGSVWMTSVTGVTFRIPQLSGVMSSMGKDPINNSTLPWLTGTENYAYGFYNDESLWAKNTYALMTKLENRQDPDRCDLKKYSIRTAGGGQWWRCGPTGPYSPYVYEASPMRISS